MIVKLAISFVFVVLAGACKGVGDKMQFHYTRSIFWGKSLYWHPKLSWMFKYKNNDHTQGPRFPGSTTFLVFLTDGWHLFEFFRYASHRAALVFAIAAFYPLLWWQGLALWAGLIIPRSIGFYLAYNILLDKQPSENSD